jgi:hypothetical protein
VFLEFRVVVMAVHLVQRPNALTARLDQLIVGGVEQEPPVLQRERLSPPQVMDVGVEFWRVALQPGQLRIVERGPEPLVQVHRDLGVQRRQLVARSPRSRMQKDPRPVVLIGGQLDEVVARSERSQLRLGPLRVLERARRSVGRHPLSCCGREP